MDRRVFSKAPFAAICWHTEGSQRTNPRYTSAIRAELDSPPPQPVTAIETGRVAKDYLAKQASGFGRDAEGAIHLTCCFYTDMLSKNTHLILRHTQLNPVPPTGHL